MGVVFAHVEVFILVCSMVAEGSRGVVLALKVPQVCHVRFCVDRSCLGPLSDATTVRAYKVIVCDVADNTRGVRQ